MIREFTDEERAAFVPGTAVLVRDGSAWHPMRIVESIEKWDNGRERVEVARMGATIDRVQFGHPGAMRLPGAAEGLDYVWTSPLNGGGQVPTVLFCGECRSPHVEVGVMRDRVLKPNQGLSSAERYVPYVEPVNRFTGTAHLDDYQVLCTRCTKAIGGWPTSIRAQEYARRLAAVRELGYLPESAKWNAQRRNLAVYLEMEEHRGLRSKAELQQAAKDYVKNGWGMALR